MQGEVDCEDSNSIILDQEDHSEWWDRKTETQKWHFGQNF